MPKYPHHPAFRAVTAALGTAILASALVLPAYASPTTSSHGPGSQSRETADISPQLRSVTSKKNGASSKKAWVDQEGDTVEAIVYFKDAGVQALAQGDPEAAAHSLQQTAQSHWAKVDTALGEIPGVTVLNRFWITSSILVRAKNDVKTLEQLAALPGATDVLPNAEIKGLDEGEGKPEPVNKPTVVSASNDQVTYGLSTIGADESWQDYGVKGEGVRVAVLDTGVDATHPDIANKLVGHNSGDPTFPGGWMNFDRFGKPVSSKPTDPGSHGTHVSGTVVGGNASGTKIGVAPNAELMAANVLSGGGSTAKIQAALQWVMAPTDANGKPAGRAADVINMSLGSDGYDPTLIQAIRNIRDAGIFPAVAIGNAPCGPTGASSPGDIYESFGVGMTDDKNVVNRGSCGTTATWPADIVKQYNWPKSFVKPNASAPGVKVFSAMPGGRWGESSGTSMASPHVAGAVALLRSVQAGLSVDEIQQALESTAYHPNPAAAPDTRYGAGVINVHRAIAKVLKQAGVKGTVTDATTGKPVSGVTVSYVRCNSGSCDEPGHGETWNTTQEGKFTARIVPGDYEFSFSQFGYEPSQPVKVTVNQTGFVDLNTKLTAVTTGTVTGTVTNAATGEPVKGTTVTVMRQGLTTTTDASGTFTFANLPIGSYEFKAEADGMRAMVSDVAEVKPAQTTRVNFKLDALKRVIVLGGPDAQTATLLAENDFVADFSPTVPDNLDAYDAVVWDAPDGVDEATLKRAIAQTDKSKTGIVWLDLGVDNNSGIAALNSLLKNPAVRTGVVDEKVTATAYRVLKADHEIFAPGTISPDPVSAVGEVPQVENLSGRGFYASFDQLAGTNIEILGDTLAYTNTSNGQCAAGQEHVGNQCRIDAGSGIAIDQRATNRYSYLSLHGAQQAVSSRKWTAAAVQVFLNTVNWTATPSANEGEDPGSHVEEPTTPEEPSPGVIHPSPGPDKNRPQHSSAGQMTRPTAPTLTRGGGASSAPAHTTASKTHKAPGAQTTPKPMTKPKPPVKDPKELNSRTAGDITVKIKDRVAHIKIPKAKPGDWFFLYVYPGEIPVDWIRVNNDGELLIDMSSIPDGTYKFAFTAEDGKFAGWVKIVVGDGGKKAASKNSPSIGSADQSPEPKAAGVASSGGFELSFAEQAMLLGCAVLLLSAAGVVVLAMRKPTA